MVNWTKVSKGSRQNRVVSSVEGLALKAGSGELEEADDISGCEWGPSGNRTLKEMEFEESWRKLQTSTNSEL